MIAYIEVFLFLAAVAAVLIFAFWVHAMIQQHGFFTMAGRWHIGHSLDGKHRTNAGWSEPATKAITPTGHAHSWHWRPQRERAAIRWGAEIGLVLAVWGWFRMRTLTVAVLVFAGLFVLTAIVLSIIHKIVNYRHNRDYVLPLEATLTLAVGVPPEVLEIERDDESGAIEGVVVEWAPEVEIGPAEQPRIVEAVETRLAIEAPEVVWQLAGRNRTVHFTPSEPPPAGVTWEDVRPAVMAGGANDLIIGLGKKRALVDASLTEDSPHIGVSIASGGGKSNLTAWLLIQRLRRGAIVLILDSKYFSHPWAFKDIDAEYGQLPNVAYAQRTDELHDAMVWAGEEVERRTQVAERAINSQGKILGNVGPELIIVCEELNLAADRLRQYWAEIRDPKEDPRKSPAFAGMGAVAYAGRAVNMRLVVIGQMLTAEVLGGGAVRENIGIRCLSRYSKNSWKMMAGDLPMPPSPSRPGHMQLVIGSTITEVQVPYVEEHVRELVMTHDMAVCPAGMPGMSRHPLLVPVPGLKALNPGPDQPFVLGQAPPETPKPRTFTLREAREEGILQVTQSAANKAAQRAAQREYPPGDFPAPVVVGRAGVAARWRGSDLYRWQQERSR